MSVMFLMSEVLPGRVGFRKRFWKEVQTLGRRFRYSDLNMVQGVSDECFTSRVWYVVPPCQQDVCLRGSVTTGNGRCVVRHNVVND